MNNMIKDVEKYFKIAPITMILIAICVIVYIFSSILYGIEMNAFEGIHFGGYNGMYVYYYHQYYRLLTANFIHFGLFHIAVNCYSLFGIGMFVEKTLSRNQFIVVALMSALATTGIPYLLFIINGFGASSVSGGISGLIFGLIGALGALSIVYKDIYRYVFRQLAPNVILMLLISVVVPSISISGHISGLIGGFVTTYIILYINKKKKDKYQNLVN